MQKKQTKFHCEKCDYICTRKFLWEQHCSTQKHIRKHMETTTSPLQAAKKKYARASNRSKQMFICECGKEYKQRSGLWKQ